MQSIISNQFPHLRVLHLLILTLWGAMFLPAFAETPASAPAFNWTHETQSGPSPRQSSAMAYDSADGKVVLFGGVGASGKLLSDTWVWDGARWTQEHPKTIPPGRYSEGIAYDAAQGKVVMFGGDVNPTNPFLKQLSDTWVWDGTNWTEEHPATSPPALFGIALAYDAADSKMVLYGALQDNKPPSFGHSETWVWDGNNWAQEHPATNPFVFYDSSMAFNAADGKLVLVGGFPHINDWVYFTYAWDGTNWTEEPGELLPDPNWTEVYDYPNQGVSLAYDSEQEKVVMVQQGYNPPFYSFRTSVWNGNNWTPETPAESPMPRVGQAMAYDAANKKVVLFGGFGSGSRLLGDTWVWGKP